MCRGLSRIVRGLLRVCGAIALGVLLAGSATFAAERYSLDVPGDGALRSLAVRDGDTLTITDAAGKSFVYVRAPKFDSADGRLLGYFSPVANQSVRWPAAGVGQFLIGDPLGAQFRVSRMTITPIPGPAVRDVRRPVPPPPADGALPGIPAVRPGVGMADHDQRLRERRRRSEPVEVALAQGRGEALYAAYIDSNGLLQVYSGWLDKWQRKSVPLREALVPGGSLTLVATGRLALPTVYTIGRRGQLLEILDGDRSRALTDRATFLAGTHLTTNGTPQFPTLNVIDDRGRIWEFGLDRGQALPIEPKADRYPPGAPLATLQMGGDEELFVIDRVGTLVNYRKSRGRWEGPDAIARGFTPGGQVAAMVLPGGIDVQLVVASVDALGNLQSFRLDGGRWTPLPLGEIPLPPGSAVGLVRAADGIHVSGVTGDGRWVDWSQQTIGNLVPREIARGFPAGAPLAFAAHDDHLHAVSVDSLGRLIAATSRNGLWSAVLCVPEFDVSPRLIRRQVNPGDALPPVTVQFSNSSAEEVFVKVLDELNPNAPIELRIPPGRSASQALKRDPPGMIEEIWLVPGPGGQWVEDVRRSAIPSPPRYRVVVYANRTTYTYVDRRKTPGPLADFGLQTPVSLGTFRLPPGIDLQDGDVFDVVKEAVVRNNPGAAALVDPRGP